MSSEKEVEYLPTIGEALSVQTRKQGRQRPMRDYRNIHQTKEPNGTTRGNLEKQIHARLYRKAPLGIVLANAKRIVDFKWASVKEKETAKLFIELYPDGIESWMTRVVQSITRRLSTRYNKEF